MDLEKGVAFYHRGFSLLLEPAPKRHQVKSWLAEEKRVEATYGDAIAPVIAEAVRRWQDTTDCCPWCTGLRHDAEEEEF